ncbi:hypothetical protein EV421DRAFT_2042648 [Armillaria borealis]|uniref:Uncharacterized protein n=1 Tax=Armillaria borealis TaxID=47425 RepID=A0AA39MDE8_9AGAR|nr:hypothetical protein EV421DRAFT_2042648 [Armillaria borealis]
MGDSDLVYSHRVPLEDLCSNLIGARAYTASYFESRILYQAPVDEIYLALEKAHPYLDAHIDTLREFSLFDCRYSLALRSQIFRLVRRIPEEERPIAWKRWELTKHEHLRDTYSLDETLCLPGDEEYQVHAEHCVPECELKPFRRHALPPPRRPQATPSPLKSPADEDRPATSRMPRPTMIRMPQAPKGPTFPSPSNKKVAVILPPQGSGSSAPLTCKRQREQEAIATASAEKAKPAKPTKSAGALQVPVTTAVASKQGPKVITKKKRAPTPPRTTRAIKKPVLPDPSSESEAESPTGEEIDAANAAAVAIDDGGTEGEEIEVPPVKKPRLTRPGRSSPPPPPPSQPAPPLPGADSSSISKGKAKASTPASPAKRGTSSRNKTTAPAANEDGDNLDDGGSAPAALAADNIDNTIYARAFHPQIDLQFHEPPLRQALENMKLSMLPPAPDSLTNSEMDLNWPCYNCTLAGFPEECVFEGEVGEEICTKCKANRHGPCSARWDANQLRRAATLLDPLTLSGDGALRRGINRVERLNTEIKLLGEAMQLLRKDREQIIGELADGLDAIASREHGTEIIDAHAQVSSFLGSFIVRLGEVNAGSEGNESASGSSAV